LPGLSMNHHHTAVIPCPDRMLSDQIERQVIGELGELHSICYYY
jgi:hypothetical protein